MMSKQLGVYAAIQSMMSSTGFRSAEAECDGQWTLEDRQHWHSFATARLNVPQALLDETPTDLAVFDTYNVVGIENWEEVRAKALEVAMGVMAISGYAAVEDSTEPADTEGSTDTAGEPEGDADTAGVPEGDADTEGDAVEEPVESEELEVTAVESDSDTGSGEITESDEPADAEPEVTATDDLEGQGSDEE